ncbi:hypothetical protein SORBI_3008G178566 [Sorghum bicolor]|uniref:Uncharacterized protein n=1 Tax=Sorghum bicolor TaxID=4558 RepID=A0A1Z5R7B3_SORBI|nr:hypothetical protein SORBI_3008G178450 [Sorghum bicolor]OQU79682.1 hypothetical protein SORBI_3008G178566 [Sorghum bicolor]
MDIDKEHLAIASSFTQVECLPDAVLLTEASIALHP